MFICKFQFLKNWQICNGGEILLDIIFGALVGIQEGTQNLFITPTISDS